MSYTDLERFYNRVKKAPDGFLVNLTSHVFNDLFTFNEERIVAIAKSFALRMDKDNADRFRDELGRFYK